MSAEAVVTLVISFFHKALRGVAAGPSLGQYMWSDTVLCVCVCVSDTKGCTEAGTGKRLICVLSLRDSRKYWAPQTAVSSLIHV